MAENLIKGHNRNKFCPCGSGLKTKKCCGIKLINKLNKAAKEKGEKYMRLLNHLKNQKTLRIKL